MAGAQITIDFDLQGEEEIYAALGAVVRQGGNLTDLFQEFGEHLLISHRERWGRQESPDGTPWAELNPKYQARKKKNQDKILILEGDLLDGLRYQASGEALLFGTDRPYGATHHFGDPNRNIPARPFLGMTDDDKTMLLEIAADHLLEL